MGFIKKKLVAFGAYALFSYCTIHISCDFSVNKNDGDPVKKEVLKKNRMIVGLHHLYSAPSKMKKNLKTLFFPYDGLKKDLEFLISQNFNCEKGKFEIGIDDNSFYDQKLFLKLAKELTSKFPKKCKPGAWAINISGSKFAGKRGDLLREFVEWGGALNTHTARHLTGTQLSKDALLHDYATGFKGIYNALKDKIKFEKISENVYRPYIHEKNKLYVNAVAPYGAIRLDQISILMKEGVPFQDTLRFPRNVEGKVKIVFDEVQLFDNLIEDGNSSNGISRIFFKPGSLRKNLKGSYTLSQGYGKDFKRESLEAINKRIY